MDPATTAKQWCRTHPDRHAVERCARCDRPACLACSIPVRGEVLCAECARREVGAPAQPPGPARGLGSRSPDATATALLGVALLASLLPWDRFGTLTSLFSAWRTPPDPWPLLAGLCLLAATASAAVVLSRRWPPILRYSVIGYTGFGAAAALATAVALFRAPDFTSHTPAPYVALAGALGAAFVGALRLRRPS